MDQPYAIIGPDNRAINFITWDGVTAFDYGQQNGNYIVSLAGVASYGFGWIWNGAAFENLEQPPSVPVQEDPPLAQT